MTNNEFAESLIKRIEEHKHLMCDGLTGLANDSYALAHDHIINIIKSEYMSLKGTWIGIDKDSRGYCDGFKCSNCGAYIYPRSCEKELDYPSCPYCLADMSDEEREI